CRFSLALEAHSISVLDPMFLRSGSLLIALFVKKNIMNSVLFTVTTASSRLYVVRVEAFFLTF
ncbi:hypothetical protein LE096_25045, partial [Escherichia coli]|nr:hypothetical protein [Escherichia coli]